MVDQRFITHSKRGVLDWLTELFVIFEIWKKKKTKDKKNVIFMMLKIRGRA